MLAIVSFLLEVIRVLLVLIIGTALLYSLESWIYRIFDKDVLDYGMLGIANIIIIFVVYRNVLQFTGWFKSSRNKKLSNTTTWKLLLIAAIFILIPIILL